MNLFSSPQFLQSLAEAYFPGRPWRPRAARLAGKCYRILEVDGRRLISSWHFVDFLEPLAADPDRDSVPVSYLPRVAGEPIDVEQWRSRGASRGELAAPLVDWSVLPTWESFEALVTSRRGKLLADTRRCRRRLEELHGPLAFRFDDKRPEALESCLRWKSGRYVASGLPDLFARAEHAGLFRRLSRSGLLLSATLSVGDRVVAAHLGALLDARFYYWMPAHDPAFAAFSPGRLLMDYLMRESRVRGAREFDFLIGDEEYKWHYATHVRAVAAVGRRPFRLVVRQSARGLARRMLSLSPGGAWLTRRLRRLSS